MGKIYLARHGETELNIAHRYQGFVDSPLTELGVAQGKALGEALKDVNIDKAYCSDLPRAYQTCLYALGDRKLEPEQHFELREHDWGEWDGRPHEEVRKMLGLDNMKQINEKPFVYYPKEGEDPRQFAERLIPFFEKLALENRDKDILIVSHHCDVKAILCLASGGDPYSGIYGFGHVNQASLSILENDEQGLRILVAGSIDHLKDVGLTANT